MPTGNLGHPVNAIWLAATTDGDWHGQFFSPLPDGITTGVVNVGLCLQAHAQHAVFVHPIRELVSGVSGSRVQDSHRHRARGVQLGTVTLVDVIQTIGGVGLH